MIAFNRDNNIDPDDLDSVVEKLEKILEKIYVDTEIPEFEDVDLTSLLETVYFHLFVDNRDYINISIKKQKNNSLKLKIEDIK